ncbi:DUF488 domain-containing protein [Microbacterium oxydans]|nr:DUF488 domain-containing protein [Microbacterium oxydans]
MGRSLVFTIGHSTHPIDDFIGMLTSNGVQQLVDVRTVPGSRHNPQFGEHALAHSLTESGLAYTRMESLGGLRYTPTGQETVNGAWRNKSFRSYADYMQTPPFTRGIDSLLDLAKDRTVAIMCAEAVPWRCHRSLIGDALLARQVDVKDIMSPTSTKPHTLTSFAAVDGHRVWYPYDEQADRPVPA